MGLFVYHFLLERSRADAYRQTLFHSVYVVTCYGTKLSALSLDGLMSFSKITLQLVPPVFTLEYPQKSVELFRDKSNTCTWLLKSSALV